MAGVDMNVAGMVIPASPLIMAGAISAALGTHIISTGINGTPEY